MQSIARVVGQFDKSEVGAHTEPTAVAPDAKLNSEYSVNPSNYQHPKMNLASAATALGSVKPRHLSQVQLTNYLSQLLPHSY
jgi:hypothetical protein